MILHNFSRNYYSFKTTPRNPGHRESPIPSVRDVRESRIAGVPDTGELQPAFLQDTRDLRTAGFRDTGESRIPGVQDTVKLRIPSVQDTPGSHFFTVHCFLNLQAIATAFKATIMQKTV